jgi:hypothetical protein
MLDPGDGGGSSSTPFRDTKIGSGLRSAGASMSRSGTSAIEAVRQQEAAHAVPSYKRGGMVRKTGLARVHRGEIVVPRHRVKRAKRAMRRTGRR